MSKYSEEIEKAINNLLEKRSLSDIDRKRIEDGESSLFNAQYGLNFDKDQRVWCFRSTRRNEFDTYTDSVEDIYPDRVADMNKFFIDMMRDVSSAVNNSDYMNYCKSYSKSLVVSLIKFNPTNNPLIIDYLPINTFDISVDAHCFNWIVIREVLGDIEDRYHIERNDINIPFKVLTSINKLIEYIDEYLIEELDSRDGMMTIDDITIGITSFILDISEIGRNTFDDYYNDLKDQKQDMIRCFKRVASYIKDKEVLTTRTFLTPKAIVVRDQKVIQIIKFILLNKLHNDNGLNKKIDSFINQLLSNSYPELVELSESEKRAIQWILNYISDKKKFDEERNLVKDINKNKYKKEYSPPLGIYNSLYNTNEDLKRELNTYRFFDSALLDDMVSKLSG